MNHSPIVITGCATGIGRDIALTLSENGYQVIATVRQEKDMQFYIDAHIECYQLDLSSSDSIHTATKQILAKHAKLLGLIHNGAYGQPGALMDISREVLTQQFETNVFGTHELTTRLLPALLAHEQGRMIYISSILGFVAAPMRGAYNSSKFALEGLAATLRLELEDTNLKIAVIQPGPIQTAFRANALARFKQHINTKESRYSQLYEQTLGRLESQTSNNKWTLPPSAVTKAVIHALGKSPKRYYSITLPTKVMRWLLRILPYSLIDAIMRKQ